MAVRERNGSWQADVKLGATRYRHTFAEKAQAEAWELEARAAHKLGQPVPEPTHSQTKPAYVMTISELVATVERKRWANGKSKHGRNNAYRYAEWVGPKLAVAEALTDEKIEAFVEHREIELGNSGSTINRYMAAIGPLVTAALKLKLISDAPELPKRSEGQARVRFYTEREEADILRTVKLWGFEDVHDYFVFLLDTGMRPSEAKRLTWEDFRNRHIILEHTVTKNSTQRVLTATPRVIEVLDRMKKKYLVSKSGPFEWAAHKQHGIRTLWERLRGHLDWMDESTLIYTFRHTCASRLVQRGIDLYRVQIWMGHKTIQMTQRYAKFAPKQLAELADALTKPSATSELKEAA